MQMRRAFIISALAPSAFAQHAPSFVLGGISLLQPNEALERRVSAVGLLADYIKRVQAVSTEWFAANSSITAMAGFIVVGIKPAQISTAWFDFSPQLSAAQSSALRDTIKRVIPMPVREGPVLFALRVGINGASPPTEAMPKPPEWGAEFKRNPKLEEISEFVLRVWL